MTARADRGLLVMPAFNEAALLGGVIARVRDAVPDLDVLVVDDGSRDATAAVARGAGAAVVSHVFNLGYGAALQTGYKRADRDGYGFVVQMDADGQHDPADIPRLIAPFLQGRADIAIGSRFVEASNYRMGATRTAGRVFLSRLLAAIGGPNIADPTSGFQVLSRPAFRLCCGEFYPTDFPDIDVLLLLHLAGLRIVEVPVQMAPSPPGRVALHGTLRDVYYVYKMLLSTLHFRLAPSPQVPPERVAAGRPQEVGS